MARRVVPTPPPSSPLVHSAADVGAFVRAKRTGEGMRIDDTAALCGVPASLLSALERAERSVGLDKALMVLESLGYAVLVLPKEQAGVWMRQLAEHQDAGDE